MADVPDLHLIVAEMRRLAEIAKNNSAEGSQDERQAWTGMAQKLKELSVLTSAPAPASGGVDAGRITLFSALEAAYIRGAAWCAEMGMTHTFSELRKAAYDYADKEEKDVICREVSGSLSPAATPVSEAGGGRFAGLMLGQNPAEVWRAQAYKLAAELDALAKPASAGGDVAREALAALLDHVDRETCTHEETHRGGFIWTICDQCGRKWADDQGGFVPHSDPPAVARARLICEGVASQSTSAGRVGE